MSHFSATRTEQDSLGDVKLPADALWGAQTQRAIDNFPISGLTLPRQALRALGLIKASAAQANHELGKLDAPLLAPILTAALAVAAGQHDDAFPVDIFQTGSGTSSNMNANEVIAHLANQHIGTVAVHPNDHVNQSQSSNDVIPTMIQVSACLAWYEQLQPALDTLLTVLEEKADALAGMVKTGRTHLMDAMPVRFDQELRGWAGQIQADRARLAHAMDDLLQLPQGGTAVGTGINSSAEFSAAFVGYLREHTGLGFTIHRNPFVGISSQDAAVACSGQLKTLACSLMKIANDLRWMNSGPLAGLAEIQLPELQPGSSIMPGKVNPVIPEAVAMVAAQVIGNDAAITVAGQSGNFQLNVMLPVVAYNVLQSITILANASELLATRAIAGFTVQQDNIEQALARNPVLITALNERIGYDQGAKLAKLAYQQQRPIKAVVAEHTDLSAAELEALLDPLALT